MKIFALIFTVLLSLNSYAQGEKVKIYNPEANASKQLDSALKVAKQQKKHVFIQIGGNWCSWCVMLHKFYNTEFQVDSAIKANYVVVLLNYSQENKNLETLKKLEFPQRFGFPALVILNSDGKRLHTQNTAYLEKGRGYDKDKVLDFLKAWSPAALEPNLYLK